MKIGIFTVRAAAKTSKEISQKPITFGGLKMTKTSNVLKMTFMAVALSAFMAPLSWATDLLTPSFENDEQKHLWFSHHSPTHMISLAKASREMAIRGSFFAYKQSGGQSINGTITQTAQEYYQYSPQPPDHLVVKLLDEDEYHFKLNDYQGNFNSPDDFLDHDHIVELEAWTPDEMLRFLLDITQQGQQVTASQEGHWHWEGSQYQVRLNYQATSYSESDSSGTVHDSQEYIQGTIQGPNVNLAVDEDRDFYLISARDSDTASTDSKTRRNQMTYNGHVYLTNSIIQKHFLNGKPSPNDPWQVDGQVSKDNAPLAIYRIEDSPGFLLINLVFNDGATLLLEQWQAY
jgi:hypothetical protein